MVYRTNQAQIPIYSVMVVMKREKKGPEEDTNRNEKGDYRTMIISLTHHETFPMRLDPDNNTLSSTHRGAGDVGFRCTISLWQSLQGQEVTLKVCPRTFFP